MSGRHRVSDVRQPRVSTVRGTEGNGQGSLSEASLSELPPYLPDSTDASNDRDSGGDVGLDRGTDEWFRKDAARLGYRGYGGLSRYYKERGMIPPRGYRLIARYELTGQEGYDAYDNASETEELDCE